MARADELTVLVVEGAVLDSVECQEVIEQFFDHFAIAVVNGELLLHASFRQRGGAGEGGVQPHLVLPLQQVAADAKRGDQGEQDQVQINPAGY